MDREVKQINLLFGFDCSKSHPHPVTPHLQAQAFVRPAPTDLAFSSSAQTDAMSCFSLSTPRYSEFIDVSFTDGKVNGKQNNEQC